MIVSTHYIAGIVEGRAMLKLLGKEAAPDVLVTLGTLCRQFPASNPVGQMYRGERDFWRKQTGA